MSLSVTNWHSNGICQADSKVNFALLHFRNRNLTSESPHISTRPAETPDKAIGVLCAKCAT